MLSTMEYPHWLMVAGAVLVVLGFVGFAFRQNGPLSLIMSLRRRRGNDARLNLLI
jgi:hypothetical protein